MPPRRRRAAATGSSPGQGTRRRARRPPAVGTRPPSRQGHPPLACETRPGHPPLAAPPASDSGCAAGSHDSNRALDGKTYSNTWYRSVLAAGFASDSESDPAGHMMLRRGIGCSQASNLNTVTFKLHFVLPGGESEACFASARVRARQFRVYNIKITHFTVNTGQSTSNCNGIHKQTHNRRGQRIKNSRLLRHWTTI